MNPRFQRVEVCCHQEGDIKAWQSVVQCRVCGEGYVRAMLPYPQFLLDHLRRQMALIWKEERQQ